MAWVLFASITTFAVFLLETLFLSSMLLILLVVTIPRMLKFDSVLFLLTMTFVIFLLKLWFVYSMMIVLAVYGMRRRRITTAMEGEG